MLTCNEPRRVNKMARPTGRRHVCSGRWGGVGRGATRYCLWQIVLGAYYSHGGGTGLGRCGSKWSSRKVDIGAGAGNISMAKLFTGTKKRDCR